MCSLSENVRLSEWTIIIMYSQAPLIGALLRERASLIVALETAFAANHAHILTYPVVKNDIRPKIHHNIEALLFFNNVRVLIEYLLSCP